MVRPLSQDRRMGVLHTPLGKDVLNLVRFDMNEGLSELFEIRVEALSERADIDFNMLLGRNCAITLTSYKGKKRQYNGVCCEGQWIGMRDDYHAYRLTLRPWFWLLTQSNDCKIFHEKNVVDIIKSVFSKAGFTDFESRLTGNYDPIHYCVQYRESKFAFLSRLMEEEGIYYYFEHTKEKHMLILADAKASHRPIPDPTIIYHPHTSRLNAEQEYMGSWMTERRFRTGKVTLRDYDFEKPKADMQAMSFASSTYKHSELELYDYPGRYTKQGKGKTLAKVKLEARQALDQHKYASGDAPSLFPGALFTLDKHISSSQNKEYLVLRATHNYISEGYRSGGGSSGGEDAYRGTYELLESAIPYRPAITTPRPMVYGPQTAVVVGEQGEEIDVDRYGRILVKFHWDRDSDISCRVRLGNLWSGKNWGSIFIPRIGMEVIVEFLEGDPDKPLVTGTVYNADNMVPYTLPDKKNIAGIKSDTTKGGGGYNEFKLDDTKGAEKITKRAEKDMDVEVRDKETRVTGEIFKTPVGSPSRETTIKNGDDKLTVDKGNQNVKIGNNQSIDVTKEIEIKAGMKITLKCGGSTITMDPSSIEIKSTVIKISADATLDAKSPMTTVKGDATLTLKGGMVLIN